MTPFIFRLDPVLRVRTAEREQRQRELAVALAQLQDAEQAIATITSEITRAREEQANDTERLQAERLAAAASYEAILRDRRQVQVGLRDEAAAEVSQRRTALLAADRAVRSLEILRETDLEQHQAEQRRRETRDYDELASRRFSAT
jgi:flagellar export protein FliJ